MQWIAVYMIESSIYIFGVLTIELIVTMFSIWLFIPIAGKIGFVSNQYSC